MGVGGAVYACSHGGIAFTGCTFSDNSGTGVGGIYAEDTFTMDNTIVAFSQGGVAIECWLTPSLACCDLFGNTGGDWVGNIANQYGVNGNISEDPLFCARNGGIYTLQSVSPCRPEADPECGLIGAWPVACEPEGVDELYSDLTISRIFPNPSTGSIEIDYEVRTEGWVSAQIVDATGRVVRQLFEGTYPSIYAGEFSLHWDGRDDSGRRAPSGVYVARVAAPGGVTTGRVVLAK